MREESAIIMSPEERATGGVLTIDLAAVRRNYRRLALRAGGAICGAVVKADAYGLGAIKVTRALLAEGCRHFFVAHLVEAQALRPIIPPDANLIVLHGAAPGAEYQFSKRDLVPVLNSLPQLAAWSAEAARMGRNLPAWLQVDTGMSRLGLSEGELRTLNLEPGRLAGIDLVGVMSHLACADTPEHPANEQQINHFEQASALLPPGLASLSASSGIFLGPAARFDLVRPGAALYGINPTPGRPNPMDPVLRLDATVLQLRRVAARTPVGYGLSQSVEHETVLATLAVGYADGFRRSLGGQEHVWRGDHPMPIVGRVSMDSLVVDTNGAVLSPGDLVELIGPHRTVDEVAATAGTIGYEILTGLGRRFARRYLD